jgi:hypothetical protein
VLHAETHVSTSLSFSAKGAVCGAHVFNAKSVCEVSMRMQIRLFNCLYCRLQFDSHGLLSTIRFFSFLDVSYVFGVVLNAVAAAGLFSTVK